jgi:hypothetical protein
VLKQSFTGYAGSAQDSVAQATAIGDFLPADQSHYDIFRMISVSKAA